MYKVGLLIILSAIWVWSAIHPLFPFDWFLENILVVFCVLLVLGIYKKFKLSNLSYTLFTIFLIGHLIGSHYTYVEVPFGFTLQEWLGSDRNMYDRGVHFSYGLLLFFPIREIYMRLGNIKGIWSYYLPIQSVASASALYEIIEWIIVLIVAPETGASFLGTQGDIWDAQKDMALATIGAMIAGIITYLGYKIYKKYILSSTNQNI